MQLRIKGLATQRLLALVAAIAGLLATVRLQVIAELAKQSPLRSRPPAGIPSSLRPYFVGLYLDPDHTRVQFAMLEWKCGLIAEPIDTLNATVSHPQHPLGLESTAAIFSGIPPPKGESCESWPVNYD